MVGVGLEVNVDYLGARAIDLAGQVVAERIVPLNGQQPTPTDPADDDGGPVAGVAPQPDPGETLARLVEVLRLVRRAAARRGARIVGAALALPGPVDRPLGPLRFAPNLGWTDLDVAGIRTGLTRTPRVRLDNEASLAARAELQARRGAAAPAGGFLYVSGGIGIGAGIVEPLGLYRGLHGWAGELGHVAVYPGGKLCPCGATGCLEQYAGRWAIAAAAGLPPRTSAARMAELAAEGRPPVVAALRQAGEALGVALAGAVNLVDIPTVVLGADLAILAPFVAPPIARQLRQRVLASRWSPVGQTVVPSAAPPLPALTGAALTVTDLVAADPLAYLP
jgi:predicted NBD/HSP70 family sugar kinase